MSGATILSLWSYQFFFHPLSFLANNSNKNSETRQNNYHPGPKALFSTKIKLITIGIFGTQTNAYTEAMAKTSTPLLEILNNTGCDTNVDTYIFPLFDYVVKHHCSDENSV